ncbi:MAG: acetyl-CoA carboxylase carboxyltransferase subunit alpha [Candidatus Margulisiibacteriota bacterium]
MAKLLDFEKPISELYDKIDALRRLSHKGDVDLSDEIKKIEKRAQKLREDIYKNLSSSQIVQIARHVDRPDTLSLCALICDEWLELHGDRAFRDDPSIVGGLAQIGDSHVVIIGHQKGHDTKENIYRNFGMPYPEGYRKALRLMKLAEKFKLPLVTFIDTPGAYPGMQAEERGQAEAIARNLKEMALLGIPIITFILGEGGSGGALALGVSNKVYMLEYAIYSVISPEGCASILFHDASKASFAAENLKLTAKDIVNLNVADGIITEPLGGAHQDWEAIAKNIKAQILVDLGAYKKVSASKIRDERYTKFRQMGRFHGTHAPI